MQSKYLVMKSLFCKIWQQNIKIIWIFHKIVLSLQPIRKTPICMKHSFSIILLCALCACSQKQVPLYTIGISLDANDHWRHKLSEEIAREANKHPNVKLIWCQADNDVEQQGKQIDSLAQVSCDLIIVSTDIPDKIDPYVNKAFEVGIPIIVSTKTNCYTAFIGTDNRRVGVLLGKAIVDYATQLHYSVKKPLKVIEIEGKQIQESTKQRHLGLTAILDTTPNIQLLCSVSGEWISEKAYTISDSLIRLYPDIQVIVAHNDIMARAAYRAAKALHPDKEYYILGVDAIADGGEGLVSIISGEINASVSNYSQGDLMVQTALKILKCQPYERNHYVPSEIVTHSSQGLMNRMANEITDDKQNILFLSNEIKHIWTEANQLRTIIVILVISLVILAMLFIVFLCVSHSRLKKQVERAKNAQMKYQQHQIDLISSELLKVKNQQSQSEKFIKDLKQIMLTHMDDPSFNIDLLSSELGVSRAQLFRKVKSYIGITPVEFMQQMRMKKAQQLLQETDLSIQQIAYSVGIQSPSYFTQQYKKTFGILPTKESRCNT